MTRKFEGNELVIATHNRGKMEEFRHLFGGRGITFYTAEDFGLPSPERDRRRAEKARRKKLEAQSDKSQEVAA
jgi:inosine/xanthosine triphosphate pyrophosphatase family protein